MNNINCEDFKTICRVCMLKCGIHFFKDAVILDIYHRLTDLHFDTNEDLPQQICMKCFEKIYEIHEFSLLCKLTHSTLTESVNNYKTLRIKQEPEVIIEETNEQMIIPDQINLMQETSIPINIEAENEEFINDLNEDSNSMNSENNFTNEEDPISTTNMEQEEYMNEFIEFPSMKNEQKPAYNYLKLVTPKRVHGGDHTFKCDQCDKSFARRYDLSRHVLVHSAERPFKCDQCTKSFTQSANLLYHKRVHSGDGLFKCDQCEKSFARRHDFTRHLLVHSDDRPFKCDECEKSFTQLVGLENHKHVHGREHRFKCDQCAKTFARQYDLTRHLRVHSNDRPYKCDQCEKSFTQSNGLVYHKRVHSGEHPYKCDQCERAFTRHHDLLRHKRLHNKRLAK